MTFNPDLQDAGDPRPTPAGDDGAEGGVMAI